MKIKTTGQRLKEYMNRYQVKQVDIINKSIPYQEKFDISMTKSHLSQYVNDKSSPDQQKLFLLAQTLKVSEAWLMGYDVDAYPINKSEPVNTNKVNNIIQIPVLGEIAAGEPIDAIENIEEYKSRVNEKTPNGELFYLKAKGNSMAPTITTGSYVLCRKQNDVENGEIAAVLVNGDNEATLKRVRKLNNMVMLESINDFYDPFIIDENNPARIVGKAVEVTTTL